MTTTTEQEQKKAYEKAWESLVDAGLLPKAFILRETYEKRLATNQPKPTRTNDHAKRTRNPHK